MDRKRFIISLRIGILLAAALGVLMHFVFDWTGKNLFVGLFAPINESVWEHMKLAFFPMFLITSFLNNKWYKINENLESIFWIATLLATWSIPVLFYFYTGSLGFGNMVADIVIFFLSVLFAYLFIFHLTKYWQKHKNIFLLFLTRGLVMIQAFAFFAFTYFSPEFAIFIPPAD